MAVSRIHQNDSSVVCFMTDAPPQRLRYGTKGFLAVPILAWQQVIPLVEPPLFVIVCFLGDNSSILCAREGLLSSEQ
jgi:hypothetical protein